MNMVNQRPYDWATPLDELGQSLYTPNMIFFIRSHMGSPASMPAARGSATVQVLLRGKRTRDRDAEGKCFRRSKHYQITTTLGPVCSRLVHF